MKLGCFKGSEHIKVVRMIQSDSFLLCYHIVKRMWSKRNLVLSVLTLALLSTSILYVILDSLSIVSNSTVK